MAQRSQREPNGFHSHTNESDNAVHDQPSLSELNLKTIPKKSHECTGVNEYEPIAVVGFSLKFPQEATSSEGFWRLMTEKRCAMTEYSKDRLNLDAFYHPDSNRSDTIPYRGGHFLEEPLGKFDAPFFSITSAEAAAMDPQHRLLLETAYTALENAGIPLEKASGSKTSVHTGCFTDDYRVTLAKDLDSPPTHTGIGVSSSMLAARISWFFNLTGPCVNLDSACSSSMMALDLACQGLRNKDSDMALVGGANLIMALETSLPLSNMNFLSHDSRCFSFDERANGYGRGEGTGVVILKRITDALKDGDTIRAIVRSTGSNQDGRTPGITQPSKDAQEILIRETYEKVGLDLHTTRYVEAHGTGTLIGDPVEASAIGAAFRETRSSEDPIYVGAVKSNIGHLEGASGIAGIIKTILVLETGVIPPNANFEQLNHNIDIDFLRIKFPQTCTPWPSKGLRRASISSFGFGGSNSHAILDDAHNFLQLRNLAGNHLTAREPPPLELIKYSAHSLTRLRPIYNLSLNTTNQDYRDTCPKLLVWSAADEGGIERLARSYDGHISQIISLTNPEEAEAYLGSLAYTLSARRTSLSWKSFAVARQLSDLQNLGTKLSKSIRSRSMPRLGYVFTGQGAQFAGMSKELLVLPVYRQSLQRSEKYLKDFGCQWSLLEEILKHKEISNIHGPAYSQPICTALQVALVDLLRDLNISPSAVVGHSSGEIAAAYCIGGLSHESACRVAYFRGYYAAKLADAGKPRGAMMSVGLSEEGLNPYLKLLRRNSDHLGVVVGCVNSPKSITVTGNEVEVDMLKTFLNKDNVFTRKLQVDVAYHSPQMKEIATDYSSAIQGLSPGSIRTSTSMMMVSSVTGQKLLFEEMRQTEYWTTNLTSPVRFSDAMKHICAASSQTSRRRLGKQHTLAVTDILEIGPHSALQGPTKDILRSIAREDISYASALVRSVPALKSVLEALGRLHCSGFTVDVVKINEACEKDRDRQIVLPDLPQYPFDHSRGYWHESRLCKEGWRLRKYPRLDLLGTSAPDWNSLEARWGKNFRLSETPWIEDHKVNGTMIYPAAGLLVMALEAVKQLTNEGRQTSGYTIRDATFHSALILSRNPEGLETQIYVRPLGDPSKGDSTLSEFKIYTRIDSQWNENCRGTIEVEYLQSETEVDRGKEKNARLLRYRNTFAEGVKRCSSDVEVKHIYDYLQNQGLAYGSAFQALQQISYSAQGEVTGSVRAFQWTTKDNTNHPQEHLIHPTTLDALLQLMPVALSKGTQDSIPTMMVTRVGKLWISNSGISYPSSSTINVHAQAAFSGHRKADASIFALDADTGGLLLTVESAEATSVATRDDPALSRSAVRRLCNNLVWKPDMDVTGSQQLLSYCECARPFRASDAEFYEDLGYVMMMFISNTLDELAGAQFVCAESHLQKYIEWLKHQFERFHRGELPGLASGSSKWASLMQDKELREALCGCLETTAQGKLFIRVGKNLLRILRGELSPLAFMFQGNAVPEFYSEINRKVLCWEPVHRYMDLMCHKDPGLKILEIGAGTGATTDLILAALGTDGASTLKCAQYDYTDISPAFFEAAAVKYEYQSSKMRFKVLDIESDPSKQGFETRAYDLIIAGSVLHATKNLEATMRNVRSLMKPGSKLLILEITKDVMRAGFAFGLLPGWWLSEEETRRWGPCISGPEWHSLMCRTGFTGADLDVPDYQDEICHEYSIIMTTAIESEQGRTTDVSKSGTLFKKISIVVTEDSYVQNNVARGLIDSISSKHTNCEIASFEQLSMSSDLDQRFCIFLIEFDKPFLISLNQRTFGMLQHVITTIPGLLWVTGGGGCFQLEEKPNFHLVDGLARVARTEFNKMVFVTLALDIGSSVDRSHQDTILRVFQNIISQSEDDFESEYIEKNGILEIGRLEEAWQLDKTVYTKTNPYQPTSYAFGSGPPLAAHIASPGLLNSIHFVEDAMANKSLDAREVEIKVESVGVNFRDCLTALGQIDTKSFGFECSGTISRVGPDCKFKAGDRVASLSMNTYRTYARSPAQCVVRIPDWMPFPEASCLPLVFATAWYSLCNVARLRSGESVLIHAGAGGTGQAAIQVAHYLNAEVYVTVGSDAKKKLLMETYGISEDRIFYSRNTSFAQGVMRVTANRGVDVVLNSLAGNGLVASWECIAPLGRFIELGKRDIHSHSSLPMWPFERGATFSSIDISVVIQERPSVVQDTLQAFMNLVAARKLRVPQPCQVFGISEMESALRIFQSGRNIGKMALEMRGNDQVRAILEPRHTYHFDESSSYLIAGGLGGLGRSAARWMASRGAKNIILLSRSGAQTSAAITLVKDLEAAGVNVRTPTCDVAVATSLSAALTTCSETMPPIKGVIQASMVLKDTILENMTFEDWKLSTGPKIQGSWNLHTLLPRDMSFFICLSSIAGIIGTGGQANYAAGNTYMDALVQSRNRRGQKATALDLGWMESEGVVAESSYLTEGTEAAGYLMPISQAEFYALLDHYCNPALEVQQPLSGNQLIVGLECPAILRARDLKEPHWMQRRTFRPLHHQQTGLPLVAELSSNESTVIDHVALFRAAPSLEDAGRLVSEALLHRLSKALAVPKEDMDSSRPLHAYGVDSLLAVELRNYFAKEMDAEVAIFDIMGAASIEAVGMTVARKSKFRADSWMEAEE